MKQVSPPDSLLPVLENPLQRDVEHPRHPERDFQRRRVLVPLDRVYGLTRDADPG